MAGWIKLHRQLTEWEWYSDVNATRVFVHLLLVANHKDGKWRGIDIKRGQRLTSISKLADETNLSIKNIRTSIKRLKATNEVASFSNAQHTVFTVVNYDLYQQEADETASKGQADGKQVATNKNVKNDNNEKKVIPLVQPEAKPKKYKFNSYQIDFAKWAYGLVLIVDPTRPEPNYDSWANDVRLMMEVDKLNGNEMVSVFTWANKDPFWGSNILSTSKFRKQYRSLLVKMNNSGNNQAPTERTQEQVNQFTAELNDQYERSQAAKARRETRAKI